MSSFVISITNRPLTSKVAVALPGKPIPIVGLKVVAPTTAPDATLDITPPYMDHTAIYGGVINISTSIDTAKPTCRYICDSVVNINSRIDIAKRSDGWVMRIGRAMVKLVPVTVDWRMHAVRSRSAAGYKRCPVQSALSNALKRMAPVEAVVTTSIGPPMPEVYEVAIAPSEGWPVLGKCKFCPLTDKDGYEKFRNLFPAFPDIGYIDIARSARLIKCPYE